MRDLRLVWPSRAERWRKPAIVAVSVGLHALVLGYVGYKAFDPPRVYGDPGSLDDPWPRPVIYVEIEPRPLVRGEVARTRETPKPDGPMQTLPDSGTRLSETTGATGSAAAGDQPDAPSPRTVAAGAPAATVRGEGASGWSPAAAEPVAPVVSLSRVPESGSVCIGPSGFGVSRVLATSPRTSGRGSIST